MDSILVFGNDEKLESLLKRSGHRLYNFDNSMPLGNFLIAHLVDLIVLDSRTKPEAVELCEMLRTEPVAKRLPLVFISKDAQVSNEVNSKNYTKIEVLDCKIPPALVLGKISTQLRIRKMTGMQDEGLASLSEINAALRDLNNHFTKELDEARAIQLSLLPKELPKDDRYELAAFYKPLEEVGGDWYFVSQGQDGLLSLQIADVTGHGLSAAFIGCMTKLALTAAGTSEPGVLLEKINKLMALQMPSGRFVTMASCLYNPDNGALSYARAGHPPAIHVKCNENSFYQIKADGFPIGFMDETNYPVVQAQLEPQDMAILITDGLSEASNRSNQLYGMDRIGEFLLRNAKETSTDQILKNLLTEFLSFIDGRLLKDDITVLLLRRLK